MTVIYIAGPMTGYPQLNVTAFYHMEAVLRRRGFIVINPAALNPCSRSWWACMMVCCWHLRLADAVVCLQGWQGSRGAQLECRIARWLGLPVYPPEALQALLQPTDDALDT